LKKYQPPAIDRSAKEESLRRARSQLRDLIFFGMDRSSKLLTLTFAEACLDRVRVGDCIALMCKKYARKTGLSLPYISVLELHPGGHGYHVHMLINSPYITQEEWQDHLWAQGIVDVRAIRRRKGLYSTFAVASYLVKYIEKDADNVPPGSHRYTKSKTWPQIPETEYLDFPSKEAALEWLKSRTDAEGSSFDAYTTKLATGEEVTIQYSQRPLRSGDLTRV